MSPAARGFATTSWESARGDGSAPGGPNPGPLMANTEGGKGGQALPTYRAQANDPSCSPQQAITP